MTAISTAKRPPITLIDYQRIYQVIYSVLEATGTAKTHRACMLFASAGATILREHYKLLATISFGCMALMVDEEKANVVLYGREEGDIFVADGEAFHAWVECDGWLIDFMAPIMGVALQEDGRDWEVPRRMLQKHLEDGKAHLRGIQHVGEFYAHHDSELAELLLDKQALQFSDLINVCTTWFRRPPKSLKPMKMGDSHGSAKTLMAHAPSIDGAW